MFTIYDIEFYDIDLMNSVNLCRNTGRTSHLLVLRPSTVSPLQNTIAPATS
jgi:hypothetical protein